MVDILFNDFEAISLLASSSQMFSVIQVSVSTLKNPISLPHPISLYSLKMACVKITHSGHETSQANVCSTLYFILIQLALLKHRDARFWRFYDKDFIFL